MVVGYCSHFEFDNFDFLERARRITRNNTRVFPRTKQLVYEIECMLQFTRESLRNYIVPPFKGEKKFACFFSSGCLQTTTHPRSRGYTSVCAFLFASTILPITSAEPALSGVYAVDLLSRWRALRGFRKTLENDHD